MLKDRIQSIIDKANTITGKSDKDITSITQSLIDGYGGGEDKPPVQVAKVTTESEVSEIEITGLNLSGDFMVTYVNYGNNCGNGLKTSVNNIPIRYNMHAGFDGSGNHPGQISYIKQRYRSNWGTRECLFALSLSPGSGEGCSPLYMGGPEEVYPITKIKVSLNDGTLGKTFATGTVFTVYEGVGDLS